MRSLLIALLILFSTVCFAQDFVINPYSVAPSSPCPPWYADTNVVWSWDGDHTTGHNTACYANGTADTADADTATTGSGYGDNSIGILIENAGEHLRWDSTGVIDQGIAQTICLKMKLSTAALGGFIRPLYAKNAGTTDVVWMQILATGQGRMDFYANSVGANALANTPPTNEWFTYGYSYQCNGTDCNAADGDHSANPGDAEFNTVWEPDNDELDTALADGTITAVYAGNYSGQDPDSGFAYLDSIAVVDEYEFDCCTLTGWTDDGTSCP